ncbi:hypothetical protein PoB_007100500 [Plakobranchus ocellatus]|uniref:Uncharacterized protein n=1 Tax=Plakobranchus ocellatus TaxID=259542 RepID=A0AAV4DK25_9GAST|nr:hypothetical protein PoB_007100500 [Plakobranchus ocellatus]
MSWSATSWSSERMTSSRDLQPRLCGCEAVSRSLNYHRLTRLTAQCLAIIDCFFPLCEEYPAGECVILSMLFVFLASVTQLSIVHWSDLLPLVSAQRQRQRQAALWFLPQASPAQNFLHLLSGHVFELFCKILSLLQARAVVLLWRIPHKHGGYASSFSERGVGGTVASEFALRCGGTFRSRVRAPPPAPLPDGGSESLRSPCCGLAL